MENSDQKKSKTYPSSKWGEQLLYFVFIFQVSSHIRKLPPKIEGVLSLTLVGALIDVATAIGINLLVLYLIRYVLFKLKVLKNRSNSNWSLFILVMVSYYTWAVLFRL